MLPQTQSSIGRKIPLEMPKLGSLKRGSEVGSEAGLQAGS